MNKKFSTLVGGLALLSSLTVGAAGFNNVKLHGSKAVDKLPLSGSGLYQIGNDSFDGSKDSVVYMTNEGKLKFVPIVADADSLANTLWCVTITDETQGANPRFDFLNKGTGQRLDITMAGLEGLAEMVLPAVADTAKVGGEIYGWAFSKTYDKGLEMNKPLYSYFAKDSVIGFASKDGGLYTVKVSAKDASIKAAVDAGLFAKFTIRTAPEIILNATQINTIFGQQAADKGVNMKFTALANGRMTEVTRNNPFYDKNNKFFASQVTDATAAANSDSLSYVYVLKADSSYLRVDTSFANTTGHGYLAYKWTGLSETTNKISAVDSLNKSVLKAQHQFLFTYRPSVDSVNIYVHRATFKTSDAAKTWNLPGDTIGFENARVFAQDLGSEMVLTIDSLEQNVHISLGYAGCEAIADNKYSIANGLYIIKNAKGQVLAAPIHKNGAIEWITLDAQKPEHMPAYQWVIYQNQAAYPTTSTIYMTNREFDGKKAPSVQLYKNDGVITSTDASFGLNKSALTFYQITDSTIIKDACLGYKHVEANKLKVTRFKSNYLHSFNHNKWIGLKDSKDSVLYVQDDNIVFTLVAGKDSVPYGIKDVNVLNKVRGLAQLVRTQYKLVANGDTLVTVAEDKYGLGSKNYGSLKVDSFYFKENNHYPEVDGKDFYAIIRAGYSNEIADTTKKVGIADDGITNSLKVQDLAETRTSAFTVEEIDANLYRRFAYDQPGLIEGTDTMRFIEQYRGEMLQVEGNTNFKVTGVDFLGINQESQAPSGLSFIVDTAWVNRGLGYIKPQYLISIDRNDIPATPGKACIEEGPHYDKDGHVTDAAHCVHATPATPAMKLGKYLVNFADSIAAGKLPASSNKGYNWKEYDRAGFVWAINYGDSLYILKGQFAGTKKSDMNKALLDKIIEANKTAKDYIINLTSDKHKFATWSMRFIKPGTDNKQFLMESMKDINHSNPEYANRNTIGKYGVNAYSKVDGDIAPEYAAWLKMQNGCLVLSNSNTSSFNSMTGGDDALIFDIKRVANDNIATDNEDINTTTVSVAAGEGKVVIKNAAGKTVAISNILGQTIANTVLTSDDATISVPAGIVVVAVEGEAAVKAIIK